MSRPDRAVPAWRCPAAARCKRSRRTSRGAKGKKNRQPPAVGEDVAEAVTDLGQRVLNRLLDLLPARLDDGERRDDGDEAQRIDIEGAPHRPRCEDDGADTTWPTTSGRRTRASRWYPACRSYLRGRCTATTAGKATSRSGPEPRAEILPRGGHDGLGLHDVPPGSEPQPCTLRRDGHLPDSDW